MYSTKSLEKISNEFKYIVILIKDIWIKKVLAFTMNWNTLQ